MLFLKNIPPPQILTFQERQKHFLNVIPLHSATSKANHKTSYLLFSSVLVKERALFNFIADAIEGLNMIFHSLTFARSRGKF